MTQIKFDHGLNGLNGCHEACGKNGKNMKNTRWMWKLSLKADEEKFVLPISEQAATVNTNFPRTSPLAARLRYLYKRFTK